MALTDKLTAIADAIRAKNGGTDAMTLAQMPEKITNIQTGTDTGDATGVKCTERTQPLAERAVKQHTQHDHRQQDAEFPCKQ